MSKKKVTIEISPFETFLKMPVKLVCLHGSDCEWVMKDEMEMKDALQYLALHGKMAHQGRERGNSRNLREKIKKQSAGLEMTES